MTAVSVPIRGSRLTLPAGFRRVAVATDFTPAGDRAIRRAARLPLAVRARLLLVHVLPGRIPRSAESVVAGAADQELAAAREKLVVLLERRGRHDVAVTTRISRGEAATELARAARGMPADLIVVGRGGARPLSGTRIGSTAQRVVREARVPVLLVRLNATTAYRRVVLGFDESADALRAARITRQMAGLPDAKVTVLHAFPDPRADLAYALSRAASRARWRANVPLLAAEVRRLRKMLTAADPEQRWHLSCKPGDPRARLLETADVKGADLLVVGTRSRQGLPRLLLGSVAEAVLNRAPCDVLVSPRKWVAF